MKELDSPFCSGKFLDSVKERKKIKKEKKKGKEKKKPIPLGLTRPFTCAVYRAFDWEKWISTVIIMQDIVPSDQQETAPSVDVAQYPLLHNTPQTTNSPAQHETSTWAA